MDETAGWPVELLLPNHLLCRLSSEAMRGAAEYVVREIFRRKRYLRPGFEIRPTDNVVDIGANMGLFALWAAPQCAAGRLLAIEPTSVCGCLRANARLNHLDHVTVVQAAVGADGGECSLVTYPGFNIVSHRSGWRPAAITRFLIWLRYGRHGRDSVVETAPCVSLGRLLDDAGLDKVNYLKLDCEGGEYEILDSLSTRDWGQIERIAMEFHELAPGQRHQRLVSLLERQGYQVEVRKSFVEYRLMRFGELWARR